MPNGPWCGTSAPSPPAAFPGRKQLIQDILVASASIPGVFPPVKIKVVADGQTFDEMHVDGGTSNQAFMFPSNFSVREADKQMKRKGVNRTLYVLRNGKVTPEFSKVKPRLASIVSKSISSLIKTQGIGDLYRMYANAQRDGIAFRAVWVPESFTMKEPKPFDPAYMKALFDVGYRNGPQRHSVGGATALSACRSVAAANRAAIARRGLPEREVIVAIP